MDIPADVPKKIEKKFLENYNAITKGTHKLMLFAGDQRVEHLNEDFFGEGIAKEDLHPEHLFRIASHANVGCFATQLGMIARYGKKYPNVNYIAKLNSKSHLIPTKQRDPMSSAWYNVEQVLELAQNANLNIRGIGYTLYLGSEFEYIQLREAAQLIREAHQAGLVTILWIYPRGKAVINEKDPHLIAGACNVANGLGSDFVKVNYPESEHTALDFREATIAAGNTKVICAGGGSTDVESFLALLHSQIYVSGASGNATGRNVHQKTLSEAVRFCNAISAVVYNNASVMDAMKVYHETRSH